MRSYKTIILVLVLVFGFSCNRSSGDQSRQSILPQSAENIESKSQLNFDTVEAQVDQGLKDTINLEENQDQNKSIPQKLQVEENREDGIENANFVSIWWLIGAIVSIVFNLILFGLLLKTINFKDKYKWERDDMEKGKDKYKSKYNDLIKSQESSQLKGYNNFPNKENKITSKSNNSKSTNPKVSEIKVEDDEKSPEVVWPINNTTPKLAQNEEKQSVSLFAEKASEDSTFSNISDQQNDHRSIFKLSLDSEQAEIAQFEVIDSDFILKMVANSPDTYLYKVCKPENSNQNFAGEIITVQKGIAHKVDGKWQVKDENKAKIKFQ